MFFYFFQPWSQLNPHLIPSKVIPQCCILVDPAILAIVVSLPMMEVVSQVLHELDHIIQWVKISKKILNNFFRTFIIHFCAFFRTLCIIEKKKSKRNYLKKTTILAFLESYKQKQIPIQVDRIQVIFHEFFRFLFSKPKLIIIFRLWINHI